MGGTETGHAAEILHKIWPEVMIETDQTEHEQNNDTQEIVRDL